jgi:Kinesin motor domain
MAAQVVKLFLKARNADDSIIDNKTFMHEGDNFLFNKIFSNHSNLNELYEEIGKPLIENILKGNNGILLVYGATGSGKRHSMYGDGGEQGIIIKILEEFFLRAYVLRSKKSMGFGFSYFETRSESVIDLFKLSENNTPKNLELREHQGNVYIDNLTITHLETVQETLELIERAKDLRKIHEIDLGSQALVQTILKVTVSQKENNMNKAGTLVIAELGDSDSDDPNVKKTLKSLRNLIIDLQEGHHASSDESTLTKILASNLKTNCLTSILFHINSLQERQTIECLKFSQSCYLHTNDSNPENILFKAHQQSERIRKLQDEINDLKHQIEKTQETHEGKLRSIGEIIGFNLNIESILSAPIGSKEQKFIESHVKSLETLDEVQQRNKRLESKLQKNSKIFEEIQKFEKKVKEKNAEQIKFYEDQIKTVKLEIIEFNQKIQENVKKQILTQVDQFQKVLTSNHMELEEKTSVIHNLPLTMQSIASDMRAVIDYKEIGKAGLEYELSKQFSLKEDMHNKIISDIKSETDKSIKYLDQEISRFSSECNDYIRVKLEKIEKLDNEMIECYEIFIKQDRLIKDIESGVFNNGIKPIYLTINQLPKPPQREKYP